MTRRYAIIVSTLAILALLLLSSCQKGERDELAKCLTDNGVKMYGASWCPHCAQQKDMFGTSFQHIEYIECSVDGTRTQNEICDDAKITRYPTWELADGKRYEAVLSLTALGKLGGCEGATE